MSNMPLFLSPPLTLESACDFYSVLHSFPMCGSFISCYHPQELTQYQDFVLRSPASATDVLSHLHQEAVQTVSPFRLYILSTSFGCLFMTGTPCHLGLGAGP
jgi:hypothetical protein